MGGAKMLGLTTPVGALANLALLAAPAAPWLWSKLTEDEEQCVAVQPGFKPKLSPQQVKEYQRLYEQKPDQFNEETVEALEQHAEYYKVPFAQSQQTFIGKVGKVMKQ